MATLAQLQAEPWWYREIVPTTLDTLEDRLCAFFGVPRYNAGDKGNEFHLYGRHRSIEWALNSAFCTDREYGTVDGRDRRGNPLHIRAFDLKVSLAQLTAMCRRLDTAVRSGRLPKVAEWFGTFDGRTVVGWYEGRPSTSDDSHLWHLHLGLWTGSADDDHTDLYEILTGDEMTKEELWAWLKSMPIAGTTGPGGNPGRTFEQAFIDDWANSHIRDTAEWARVNAKLDLLASKVDLDPAELAAVGEAAAAAVDEQAIAEGVLAGLGAKSPEDVAAALRAVMTPEQARAVGAILAAAQ